LSAGENRATIVADTASHPGVAMSTRLHPIALCALLAAATPVWAAIAPAEAAKAGEQCETKVAETVTRMRGKDAQEVQFVGGKRALTPTSDDETGVKGEGRYRSASGRATTFTYSCYYNTKSGETSGVVFRDTGGGAPLPEATAWQPDLSNVSPEACESAAAASLKDKHPRVGRIVLDADTRRVAPGPDGHLLLEGRGAVQRAPGMNANPFGYRCEFDRRGLRIVDVQTTE
jgi:hypothetical protein